LSSAILYLAIVAIWAVVLVPRWLRPRPAPPQPVPVPVEADWHEPAGLGQDATAGRAATANGLGAPAVPVTAAAPVTAAPVTAAAPVVGAGVSGAYVSGVEAGDADVADEATAPPPAMRRTEVLKARRRLLITLVTLTAIAGALAVTRIDAYWIVIPPVALLGGYVALLRKFARIDAEQARRAARIRHAAASAGQEPAAPGESLPAAAEPGPGSPPDATAATGSAEIIDISGRIGDQVYDQYSDAANRAVGD
jgi:hypothetical protein